MLPMLFEDREKTMAPQKESQFTVRMDEDTYNWLVRKAGELDTNQSAIIRAAVIVAMPQLEQIPDLLNIRLEDIKGAEE